MDIERERMLNSRIGTVDIGSGDGKGYCVEGIKKEIQSW